MLKLRLRLRSRSDSGAVDLCFIAKRSHAAAPFSFPPAALGLRLTKLHATVATATTTTMRQFL